MELNARQVASASAFTACAFLLGLHNMFYLSEYLHLTILFTNWHYLQSTVIVYNLILILLAAGVWVSQLRPWALIISLYASASIVTQFVINPSLLTIQPFYFVFSFLVFLATVLSFWVDSIIDRLRSYNQSRSVFVKICAAIFSIYLFGLWFYLFGSFSLFWLLDSLLGYWWILPMSLVLVSCAIGVWFQKTRVLSVFIASFLIYLVFNTTLNYYGPSISNITIFLALLVFIADGGYRAFKLDDDLTLQTQDWESRLSVRSAHISLLLNFLGLGFFFTGSIIFGLYLFAVLFAVLGAIFSIRSIIHSNQQVVVYYGAGMLALSILLVYLSFAVASYPILT